MGIGVDARVARWNACGVGVLLFVGIATPASGGLIFVSQSRSVSAQYNKGPLHGNPFIEPVSQQYSATAAAFETFSGGASFSPGGSASHASSFGLDGHALQVSMAVGPGYSIAGNTFYENYGGSSSFSATFELTALTDFVWTSSAIWPFTAPVLNGPSGRVPLPGITFPSVTGQLPAGLYTLSLGASSMDAAGGSAQFTLDVPNTNVIVPEPTGAALVATLAAGALSRRKRA
jgi:hypothetical protein